MASGQARSSSGVVRGQLEGVLFFRQQGREPPVDERAFVHLQRTVEHIATNSRLGLQLQQHLGMNRAVHDAIDDDVIGPDFALNNGCFGDYQNAGEAFLGRKIARYLALNPQALGKRHISHQLRAARNQAFEWRLLLFIKHCVQAFMVSQLYFDRLGGAQCGTFEQFDSEAFDQHLRRHVIHTFDPAVLTQLHRNAVLAAPDTRPRLAIEDS